MVGETEPIDVGNIYPEERDYGLSLNDDNWGIRLEGKRGWNIERTFNGATKYLSRIIEVDDKGRTWLPRQDHENCLTETIVRFPAAPIYRIHREQEYTYLIPRIYYQSMRVLHRP